MLPSFAAFWLLPVGRGERPRRPALFQGAPHVGAVVVLGERGEGGVAPQPRSGRQLGEGPAAPGYCVFGTGGGPAGTYGL